jgi:hypothetical protein
MVHQGIFCQKVVNGNECPGVLLRSNSCEEEKTEPVDSMLSPGLIIESESAKGSVLQVSSAEFDRGDILAVMRILRAPVADETEEDRAILQKLRTAIAEGLGLDPREVRFRSDPEVVRVCFLRPADEERVGVLNPDEPSGKPRLWVVTFAGLARWGATSVKAFVEMFDYLAEHGSL